MSSSRFLYRYAADHAVEKAMHSNSNSITFLFLNLSKISEFLGLIYSCETEIKETTKFTTYLAMELLLLGLMTRLNFPKANFTSWSRIILSALAQGFYVSQLVYYRRACFKYQNLTALGTHWLWCLVGYACARKLIYM